MSLFKYSLLFVKHGIAQKTVNNRQFGINECPFRDHEVYYNKL